MDIESVTEARISEEKEELEQKLNAALVELEELRSGILQAYMRSAEHGDRVLYVCMKAHHMAANKAIVKLGGEAVELPVLDHFLENVEALAPATGSASLPQGKGF